MKKLERLNYDDGYTQFRYYDLDYDNKSREDYRRTEKEIKRINIATFNADEAMKDLVPVMFERDEIFLDENQPEYHDIMKKFHKDNWVTHNDYGIELRTPNFVENGNLYIVNDVYESKYFYV